MNNLLDYVAHRAVAQQLHIACLTRKGGEADKTSLDFWTLRRAAEGLQTLGCDVPVDEFAKSRPIHIQVYGTSLKLSIPRYSDDPDLDGWCKSKGKYFLGTTVVWTTTVKPKFDSRTALSRFVRTMRYHIQKNGDRWLYRPSLIGCYGRGWTERTPHQLKELIRFFTSKPHYFGGPRLRAIPDAAMDDLLGMLACE